MAGGRAPRRSRRVPPPVHDRAAHGAASLQMRLLLALLLVFSTGQYPSCYGNGGHGGAAPGGETAGGSKCMEREREALLAVRDDVWAGATDRVLKRLPSWKRDGDCCRWKGVACDHRSGHVVKLDLRYYREYDWNAPGRSKVNPSLLNLGSLRYLDLSGNSFDGSPLPSFIGSLVNLEYLYINNTNFAGSVPVELGNLQNLKSLDLIGGFSFSSTTVVENFRWLSHLSHLQFLGMSGLNLSAAHDWFQVISMLPSLSLLRLYDCDLRSPPPNTTQIPLGNFTSLSTLELGSSNLAYSTWPLWLSSFSSVDTKFFVHKKYENQWPNTTKNRPRRTPHRAVRSSRLPLAIGSRGENPKKKRREDREGGSGLGLPQKNLIPISSSGGGGGAQKKKKTEERKKGRLLPWLPCSSAPAPARISFVLLAAPWSCSPRPARLHHLLRPGREREPGRLILPGCCLAASTPPSHTLLTPLLRPSRARTRPPSYFLWVGCCSWGDSPPIFLQPLLGSELKEQREAAPPCSSTPYPSGGCCTQ